MKKRIFVMLLTVLMIVGMFAVGAITALADNTATVDTAYYALDVYEGAYIDTGYMPNSTTRVLFDAEIVSSSAYLFGVDFSPAVGVSCAFYVNAGKNEDTYEYVYGSGWGIGDAGVAWGWNDIPLVYNRQTVELSPGQFKSGENVKAYEGIDFAASDIPMYLFALNFFNDHIDTFYNQHVRFYSCKIFEGNNLVHRFVPAKSGTDIGVYDTVGGGFYKMQGNGTAELQPYQYHYHGGLAFAPWDDTTTLPDTAGNWYLTEDVTLTADWNVPSGGVNLCLHDRVVKLDGHKINVNSNASFGLYDCGGTGRYYDKDGNGLWNLNTAKTSGTETTVGGVIIGGSVWGGGGSVNVEGGSFTMNGGTICGNTAQRGAGGVYVKGGSFTMNDGTVCGNALRDESGGVYVAGGRFTMDGGTVSGNTAQKTGGGVYVKGGSFTMTGGTVSGNTASGSISGGGVCVTGGSFTMSGGTVCGNTTTGDDSAGGVYVNGGNFTMSGGEISGNTATDKNSAGGIFARNISFSVGGTVSGNTATGDDSAGGVYVGYHCSLAMSKSEISDNTATGNNSGGGVYVDSGNFSMSGGAVSNNKASGSNGGGGVYVVDGGSFTMTGGAVKANTGAGGIRNYGGALTLGGTANVESNLAGTEVSNLVNVSGTVTIGDKRPKSGMRVGLSGIDIEVTGAQSGDQQYFFADDGNYQVVFVGGKLKLQNFDHKHGDVEFYSWDGTGLPDTPGNWCLTGDVKLTSNWTVPSGDVNLCLHGHVINLDRYQIVVKSGAKLSLYDDEGSTIRYYNKDDSGLWKLSDGENATDGCTTTGGVITGGPNGGVRVNGSFIMNGGTICGGSNGAVQVSDGGSFTMNGGTVCGNTATDSSSAGGVCVNSDSSFTMNGGTVCGNTAAYSNSAGGVYVLNGSSFTMTGGTVTGNTATDSSSAGGVQVSGGSFTMNGGTVTGNTATGMSSAGGVFVSLNSSFTMTDGTVTDNTATDGGSVGGIRSNGTLTLGGTAKVEDNVAGDAVSNVQSNSGFATISSVTRPAEGMHVGLSVSSTKVTNAKESDKAYFFSDNPDYEVAFIADSGSDNGILLLQHPIHIHGDVEFMTWDNNNTLPSPSGNFYLTKDVTLSDDWTVPSGDVNICLHDHVINLNGHKIVVPSGAKLSLYDDEGGTIRYYSKDDSGLWTLSTQDAATDGCTTVGGVITGGTEGAVYVDGSFTMNGGTVCGNTATDILSAGGVYGFGSFTMNGGTVCGNTAADSTSAGGVFVDSYGSFTMTGGTVTGNTAAGNFAAGGVYVYGGSSFAMNGGTVTGNTAARDNSAGGVFVDLGSSFTMNGGTVCDNTAVDSYAGGIYFSSDSSLTLGGTAKVEGNTVGDAVSNVQSDGDFATISSVTRPAEGMHVGLSGSSIEVTNARSGDQKYFFSDDPDYEVAFVEDDGGKLVLQSLHHFHDGIEFRKWTGTGLPDSEGNWYLTENVTLSADWVIPDDVNICLCLNDHVINLNTHTIAVLEDANLSLYDDKGSTTRYYSKDDSGLWKLSDEENATQGCTTVGGVITGGANSAVSVFEGSFTMAGGTICGNTTPIYRAAGGVYVFNGGSFTMAGGTVCGNTATHTDSAGGVFVNGSSFTMTGGTITDNTAVENNSAGGVNVDGSFTMNGGTISGNTAAGTDSAGGVYVNVGGSFTMNGGTITDNTAVENNSAGGVYVNVGGSFTMNGGTISSNTAADTDSVGGVYVNGGSFTMTGGMVSGNTAAGTDNTAADTDNTAADTDSVGGVYVFTGSFTMTGGTVTGNTATDKDNAGGIYLRSQSSLTLGGTAKVEGNTINGAASNVMCDRGTVAISSDARPQSGMRVGLSCGVEVSNAQSGDQAFFFSDDSTYYVTYNDGTLTLTTGKQITRVIKYGKGTLELSGIGVKFGTDSVGAAAGSEVTVKVTPDNGYKLVSLTVTREDGEPFELTPTETTGEYTFIMPDCGVRAEVLFVEVDDVVGLNGKYYKSLSDTLDAAESGDTLTLVDDVVGEKFIMVETGITLDLNGHSITGGKLIYVSGNIVDTGKTKGVFSATSYTFSASQQWTPIYDSKRGGYSLFNLSFADVNTIVNANGQIQFTLLKSDGERNAAYRALTAGEDYDYDYTDRFKVVLKVRWDAGNYFEERNFVYKKSFVDQVISKTLAGNNSAFAAGVKGTGGGATAQPRYVVCDDLGNEIYSLDGPVFTTDDGITWTKN